MKALNYIGFIGAGIVCVTSILGGVLELYGTETNAFLAHILAAIAWGILAYKDLKSGK